MKLRSNAYSVIGIILMVIVGILTAANIRPIHDQCPWQFPKILSCLLSARETLAAGLIGAGGAIFAAWLAWTAVREQIAVDKRQIAEGKVAQKRAVVSQLENKIECLRSAQDDLNDAVKQFPDHKDPQQHAFALALAGMYRTYSFRSVQRAQGAPDGLGEQVWNSLNQLRMMAGNINNEVHSLSADQQIGVLATWDAKVRDRVTDNRNLLDKVNHALNTYEGRLASAQQQLQDLERKPMSAAAYGRIALFVTAFGLATVHASIVQSQQPSPGGQPQTSTQATQQEPAPNDRAAQNPPPTEKTLAEPKTEKEADRETTERDEKASSDWWMVKLTGGLLLIGVAQLAAFIVQAQRLKQTVDIMKDTAERQLRAYVHVAEIKVTDDGNRLTYYLEFRNFGQTPAYSVSLKYGIALKDYPLNTVLALPEELKSFNAVLPPQVPIHDNFTPLQTLGPNQRGRLLQRTAAIYVYGVITYGDIFQKQRITKFRYQYGGVDGPSESGALAISEEGNKAT